MPDPRVTKLAQVLVRYSLALKAGDELVLHTTPLAQEPNLEVYKEAILAGAHVSILPIYQPARWRNASNLRQ